MWSARCVWVAGTADVKRPHPLAAMSTSKLGTPLARRREKTWHASTLSPATNAYHDNPGFKPPNTGWPNIRETTSSVAIANILSAR